VFGIIKKGEVETERMLGDIATKKKEEKCVKSHALLVFYFSEKGVKERQSSRNHP